MTLSHPQRACFETPFGSAEALLSMTPYEDGIEKAVILRCLARRGLEGRTTLIHRISRLLK
jgi:hypothetical protein